MNLEQRIRQHYPREDHPSVFELLDENARLRAAYSEACRAAYNEVVPDCGETMGVAVYHAVKTVLRKALEDK